MDIKNTVRLMKDVSKYGFDYLQNGHFIPEQMTDKQVLMMAYFANAQANFDGTVALLCKPKSQPTTTKLQLRALQEVWINMSLMTCTEGELWSSYLYTISEYNRIKVAKWLHEDKQIDDAGLERITAEATNLADIIVRSNPLPDIDGVMHPSRSRRDYYVKPLTLRERCQVVDHYNQADPDNSMTKNYDLIYSYLSNFVHQDAREMTSSVREYENEYIWDIAGSALEIQKTMSTSYAYYTGCLRIFTDLIGNTNERRMKLFQSRFEKYLR
jgi:hypothetical protein